MSSPNRKLQYLIAGIAILLFFSGITIYLIVEKAKIVWWSMGIGFSIMIIASIVLSVVRIKVLRKQKNRTKGAE